MYLGVIGDHERYPNDMLKDLNFELTFNADNKFENNLELKKVYEEIMRLQNAAILNYQ